MRQRANPALPAAAWVADDEDQAAIGDPLARIAARHAPLTGEGAGDVADGIAALVGTAGYGLKGLQAEAEADAAPRPRVVVDVDVVEGAQPADDGPPPPPRPPTSAYEAAAPPWGPG